MPEIYLGASPLESGHLMFDLFVGRAHYRRMDRALDGRRWETGKWKRIQRTYGDPFSDPHTYAKYNPSIKCLPNLQSVREQIQWKRNLLWGTTFYMAKDVAYAKARMAAEGVNSHDPA